MELVEALARRGDMGITVGAYPERHPEATSATADVEHLKAKIDAGADQAITQFFFDNDSFYRFRDACAAAGITAPIVPGILPVENFQKLKGFAARCGAQIPDWMRAAFANVGSDEDAMLLSTAIATEQCADLMEQGVDHLHLYTLNLPDLTCSVCTALGFEPSPFSTAGRASACPCDNLHAVGPSGRPSRKGSFRGRRGTEQCASSGTGDRDKDRGTR